VTWSQPAPDVTLGEGLVLAVLIADIPKDVRDDGAK
jgi:hypothetical protein